jgi:glycosyltransferase involved in cell wall biosynthesis
MPNTSLSVVVPATAAAPTLDRCLAAIDRGLERPEQVVVQREPRGAGPALARNIAAREAIGDVLVFVDADVELHRDAIARIRARFAGDAGLVALFGAYDDRPAAPGAVSRFRNLLHHHVHASSGGPAETFWAGLGAVRRDAFLEAGGFDSERYRVPAIEDIELGTRLHAAGFRIELDPRIGGTHLKHWSLAGMVRTDLTRRGIPWVRLQLDARAASRALNLGWRHRLSAAASLGLVAALVARRPRGALLAAGSMAVLNARFYALLARRGGPSLLAAGLPLHVIHGLTAAAAVPAGALANLAGRIAAGWRDASRGT